jgi:crotonobetainyl-CoA:carnitine CoA-transferase CaiB-like acyl-CoA transferase
MGQSWGKRSIGLDVRDAGDREIILALARQADVIVENQLAGFWAGKGVDFATLRRERPALVVCSVTGFGQTGPWATLPAHGLNMDALADTLPVEWEDGQPRRGATFTSWGNELGTAFAAMAVVAALLSARTIGEGAWIDVSCWDALVESHRTEIAMTKRLKRPFTLHGRPRQALYDTYLSSDGVPVLLGALEHKFWKRFCEQIGRPDLIGRHSGAPLEFGDDDDGLRAELETEFAKATAAEWLERFVSWDVPGGPVLEIPQVMETGHFAARRIAEGEDGAWPNVTTAIRWHHTGERAGAGLTPPPAFDENREEILRDWLG